jgi:ABC-2 type transport system permease protein
MSGLTLFWRAMLARAYPRIIGLVREPTWVIQETVLPILSVSAYALVYRMLDAPNYIAFVILGGAMAAFWLNVLWAMAAQFFWERDSGLLELYVMAPAPTMAILAGMALGGIVMTLVRAGTILIAGLLLFDLRLQPSSWLALLGVFLLTLLALYGLGMMFASAFLMWGREAWHLVNLFQEPVYLFSGLNYPVRTLGSVVALLAAALPLTTGVDALRQLLFGTDAVGLMPLWLEVILLAFSALVFLVLASWCLAVLERRARQEGRLSSRNQ